MAVRQIPQRVHSHIGPAGCLWTHRATPQTPMPPSPPLGPQVANPVARASTCDARFEFPQFLGNAQSQVELLVGAHTLRGQKQISPGWPNQDTHLVQPLGPGLLLVGVFDGHGQNGHHISSRVRGMAVEHAQTLVADIAAGRTGASSLARLFTMMHETVVSEGLARWSGTTATICLIDLARNVATVGHAGDSTLVITSGSEVLFKSRDHKVDEETRRRVAACGGEVRDTTYEGKSTTRVFLAGSQLPGLAMSRAIGDQEAHAVGVVCEPEVVTLSFREGNSLVVASDGVWDHVSAEEAAQRLNSFPIDSKRGVQEAAQSLVAGARARYRPEGDIDDITAVVVRAANVSDMWNPQPKCSIAVTEQRPTSVLIRPAIAGC
eukprot:TRINITY_DN6525_c0_g1_i2.p1 TRINITY_DN6525_c0_g1~~TRINITY_DN6525_c0_g1_i2.p1  ORF type:complete len:422 (+),score=49.44 TRINITY_DN6525_c0_g1_i2:135-1268(+)